MQIVDEMIFGIVLWNHLSNEPSPSPFRSSIGRSQICNKIGGSIPLLLSFCASLLPSCRAHTARRCNSGARFRMQSKQEDRKESEAWGNPKIFDPPPSCKFAGWITDADMSLWLYGSKCAQQEPYSKNNSYNFLDFYVTIRAGTCLKDKGYKSYNGCKNYYS